MSEQDNSLDTARNTLFGELRWKLEYWGADGIEATDGANELIDAYRDELLAPVIKVLRDMDAQQRKTDFDGAAELAWFYSRADVEDALGVVRGTLDATSFSSAEQVMAYAKELAEEFGEEWPLSAPPDVELPIGEWWADVDDWMPVRDEIGTLTGFVRRGEGAGS